MATFYFGGSSGTMGPNGDLSNPANWSNSGDTPLSSLSITQSDYVDIRKSVTAGSVSSFYSLTIAAGVTAATGLTSLSPASGGSVTCNGTATIAGNCSGNISVSVGAAGILTSTLYLAATSSNSFAVAAGGQLIGGGSTYLYGSGGGTPSYSFTSGCYITGCAIGSYNPNTSLTFSGVNFTSCQISAGYGGTNGSVTLSSDGTVSGCSVTAYGTGAITCNAVTSGTGNQFTCAATTSNGITLTNSTANASLQTSGATIVLGGTGKVYSGITVSGGPVSMATTGTVSFSASTVGVAFTMTNGTVDAGTFGGATLAVNGGTLGGTGTVVVSSTTAITLGGGTVTQSSGTTTINSTSVTFNSGTISRGTWAAAITNGGTISGGTFNAMVTNVIGKTISDGSFMAGVTNGGTLTGGTFYAPSTSSNVVGGGTFTAAATLTLSAQYISAGTFNADVIVSGGTAYVRGGTFNAGLIFGASTYGFRYGSINRWVQFGTAKFYAPTAPDLVAVGNVLEGVTIVPAGNVGTYRPAAANKVVNDTQFGDTATLQTGTVKLPVAANVLTSETFGPNAATPGQFIDPGDVNVIYPVAVGVSPRAGRYYPPTPSSVIPSGSVRRQLLFPLNDN